MPEVFSIKLAGPAGYGVLLAGEILFRSLVKMGYFAMGYPEYPSLIKGGHNTFLITISEKPFPTNAANVDLLVALSQTALDNEHSYIDSSTVVVCDQTLKPDHKIEKLIQPNLLESAKAAGNPLTLNTAAVGFVGAQLKINPDIIWSQIQEQLGSKSDQLLKQNQLAFQSAASLSDKYHTNLNLPAKNNKQAQLCLTGSVATGLGAIAAGVNLYSAYPMTPSSPLLHFMSSHQTEFDYVVRQAADEISAINMIIGASYAGAKTMTGTSGGGFALMNEGLSLAGMLETPIVVYLAMRPAPATGLPTWTSQSDLLYAINAGHGEFPRVVLAPSDPKESYLLTHRAFSISQRFHIPVIILTDKYLTENLFSSESLPPLPIVPLSVHTPDNNSDEMFSRYAFTLTGINHRTIPGMVGGEYVANSDEHNAQGLVDEGAENRNSMNSRRLAKQKEVVKEIPLPEVTGGGDTALLSWGSHKYIGQKVATEMNFTHVHFSYLWPLPEGLENLLAKFKKIIAIENNTTHQLARLIRQETGIGSDIAIGEDSGRPLDPQSLIKQIKNES